ncbi:expressed unknown protein [Seminavis robusta]|uniref:Uncharacterized protein n=1 Tax=Seminavis robusta TaxID=568900 RepID=A0A9N8E055_9STRA|nr:expressed unknown protein [Seminavis robusta]|eukprot:Sro488_g152990.1 n/a (419) ;mRNA; f:5289-6545
MQGENQGSWNQHPFFSALFRRHRYVVGILLLVGTFVFYWTGRSISTRGTDASWNPQVDTVKSISNFNKADNHTTTTTNYVDTTTTITKSTTAVASTKEDYCIWSPSSPRNCQKVLHDRIAQQTVSSSARYSWLFFGDSTVAQLWYTSSLQNLLVDLAVTQLQEQEGAQCVSLSHTNCHSVRISQQCHLNQAYNLSLPRHWESPRLGEGPAKNATDPTELCLGCHSCHSSFIQCSPNRNSYNNTPASNRNICRPILYGGYIAMPFARDVILQTPHYRTSQENLLLEYLTTNNQQQSICVVRTGLHDMALPDMTQSLFVSNVQWYLRLLLRRVCAHVIWLQNTAPSANATKYPQTMERVRAYDEGVYDALQQPLSDQVTTVDVWEASLQAQHADHIHLTSDWNRALGMFFVKLATKLTVP